MIIIIILITIITIITIIMSIREDNDGGAISMLLMDMMIVNTVKYFLKSENTKKNTLKH